MSKKIYEVRGTYTISVYKRVKAEDEYEATQLAKEHFSGIEEYVGNGGYDKLIGVSEYSESVAANGEVEWEEAYETDDDRYDEATDNEFCTYKCILCGETFECEDDYAFEYHVLDALWEHIETEHEEAYEECKEWDNLKMIEEFFEREE